MTTILTEAPRAGAYIADEVSINLSRRVVTLSGGQGAFLAGTVLGKVTSSGEYVKLNPSADTGAQVAAAILFDAVEASDADVQAVATVALTGVNESELTWPSGINPTQRANAIAALATHNIVVLSATPAAPTIGATALAFVAPMPTTGDVDTDIGPIQVRIENEDGLLVSGDNTTSVALTKSSGPGTLTTTTPVTAVNGIATFEEVELSAAGTVVLTAAASGLTSAVSANIVISA
jgi:hypothetical protein